MAAINGSVRRKEARARAGGQPKNGANGKGSSPSVIPQAMQAKGGRTQAVSGSQPSSMRRPTANGQKMGQIQRELAWGGGLISELSQQSTRPPRKKPSFVAKKGSDLSSVFVVPDC